MRDWGAYVRSQLSLPDLTPEREARIVRELAAQLEDFYREALVRGLSEREADAHARAQITDWRRMADDLRVADHRHARPRLERLTDTIQDRSTHTRRGSLQMLADTLTDMRYGARQLVKAPGFAIVAILTLAFGIGATTAIFSVVNAVMLRPLPYPHPDALVRVVEVVPRYGRFAVAPANFFDWRQQNTVFERIGMYVSTTGNYVGTEGPERLQGTAVSWDMFDLLGVPPRQGRGFRQDEDVPKQNNVIVLSHGTWQRRFGGDPNIVGGSITLSGTPVTIVGVMPQDFYFPNRETEYWRPIAMNPASANRGAHFVGVIARLKAGVSVEQAHVEIKTIAERLAQQYPEDSANESAEVITVQEMIVGPVRPMLMTLLGAVAVVVLIACANVANLLLVRASVREKEIAIRAALGASRRRLAMQMLAESAVLAALGGGLGVLIAYLALPAIQTLSAGSIPRASELALDQSVLLVALGVTLLTGIVFGLAPAWQALRSGPGAALKEGGRSSVTSGGRLIRNGLLVAEVALSIVLLVGAVLLLRSFAKITSVDPGFRAENVLAFQVALPPTGYSKPHNVTAFYDRLLERLHATPGITGAGIVQSLPMRGGYVLSFDVQGRPPARPGEEPSANYRSVSARYFQTLGIPLLRGRVFTETDAAGSPMVAVVDEAFVQRHFPNEDPLGRGIDIGNGTDGFFEIVGVVGNVHHEGLDQTAQPTMYVPYTQDAIGVMWILARTQGEPLQMSGAVREAVRQIDPGLPAFSLTPLEDVVTESVAERRFALFLLGIFAAVALFLAAVGLYGVVAYMVSQRTQEIGVRMAIGARPADVLRMVIGGGMKLALLGTGIGLAGALALAQYVASMLFDVTPFDPASYAATAAILLAVAALACYVPARRAMRVDPLVALRQE